MEAKLAVTSYTLEDSQLVADAVRLLAGPEAEVLHTEKRSAKQLVEGKEHFVFQCILDLPTAILNKLALFYNSIDTQEAAAVLLENYGDLKLCEFANLFIEGNERWLAREIIKWAEVSVPVVSARSYVLQRTKMQENVPLYVSKLVKFFPVDEDKESLLYDLFLNAPLLSHVSLLDQPTLDKINNLKLQLLTK